MSRSTLDSLLGIISDEGTELEFLGGLNFIGFTITKDSANNRWDIEAIGGGGAVDSDDVENLSGVTGATVTEALDALNTADGLRALAATQVIAGAGLTGGGTLAADRTLNVVAHADGTIVVNANDVQVGVLVAGNYANNTIALARLVNATDSSRFMMRGMGAGAGAWTDGSSNDALAALSGGSIDSLSITTLTTATINGAAPLAPVEGTALADADANIVATDGSQIRIPTLTANRTYDINNTGAIDEESITLYRTGTEAFTATIRDNADATIATFPASTKLAGVFRKETGANFVFVGFYRLA